MCDDGLSMKSYRCGGHISRISISFFAASLVSGNDEENGMNNRYMQNSTSKSLTWSHLYLEPK